MKSAPNGRHEFDEFMEGLGYKTDEEKANAIGIRTRTVIQKIRKEFQDPSPEFVVAVWITYPKVPFDRFFERVTV